MRFALITLPIACTVVALCAAPVAANAGTPIVVAAAKTTTTTAAPKKKATSKKRRIKIIRSRSEETRSERDRRLRRECQGRPNAGACLGYTR